jgi:hemoglobin-like flavoprotein
MPISLQTGVRAKGVPRRVLSDEMTERFNDSLERCRRNPTFLDSFYQRLMAAAPEIRAMFRHTDLGRQKRLLGLSLYCLVLGSMGCLEGQVHLDRLAVFHARPELGIQPEHFDLWFACLLATVAECDPAFDATVEEAWRARLLPSVRFIQTACAGAGKGAPAPPATS